MQSSAGPRGSPSVAAWTGFTVGAALPGLIGAAFAVLAARSPGPAPFDWEAVRFLVASVAGGGLAGALAGWACSKVAGPTYPARSLASVAVAAMYAGAVLGSGLNRWDRPAWHHWLSILGGAVVGVLAVALFIRRERAAEAAALKPPSSGDRTGTDSDA